MHIGVCCSPGKSTTINKYMFICILCSQVVLHAKVKNSNEKTEENNAERYFNPDDKSVSSNVSIFRTFVMSTFLFTEQKTV